MKIIHIATMHRRDDARVLVKECCTLVRAGHDVSFVVADGAGDERVEGVSIIDVGVVGGRIAGKIVPMYRAYLVARTKRPDVVHFHDGMFLPFAIWLSVVRQTVFYDVHEDRPREVMDMRFSWPAKRAASLVYSLLEWVGGYCFKRIIAATPHIAMRFPRHKTVTVQNFPLHGELAVPNPKPHAARPAHLVYVGSITVDRGIFEIVDSMAVVGSKAIVELAGRFSPADLQSEVEKRPGWLWIKFRGWQSRSDIGQLLANARAGLLVLHPRESYLPSYPVKLFEYMSAGIPVIASDFPLWRQIVDGAGCGLLVDPLDPEAIAKAIAWILDNPDEAEAMGRRGCEAVLETYNWESEATKLLSCYSTEAKA